VREDAGKIRQRRVIIVSDILDFLGGDLPEESTAPEKKKSSSLASFFDTLPQHGNSDWKAQEPPDLTGIDQIVLNVETNGLQWANGDRPIGITVGTLDGQLKRFLPFGFNGGGNLDESVVKRWAQEQLKHKHITNTRTSFDVHMMRVWGIDLEEQGNTVSDIQHYAALIDDHRRRFALDVLAKDFLGKIEVAKLDERDMQQYAASEVAERAEYQVQLVAEIRNIMWPILDAQDLQRVRQLEDDVIFPVCEMEKNGAQIDVELLNQFSDDCVNEHKRLLKEVSKEVGFNFDLSTESWQRLFEKYSLPTKALKSGKASFAEDVVSRVDHPVVKKAHLADQYGTLHSKTFAAYKKLIDKDGVLRFDINQLRGDDGGTVSGRFSIGYVQQVPNKDNHTKVFGDHLFPRKLFVAKVGDVLSADAAQIEYRIFAHYANNKKVIDAYQKDPSLSFHRLLHGMIKKFKKDMLYTDQKSLNFMKMYAGGLIKIAVMMGHITAEEGEEIRKAGAIRSDKRLTQAREINRIYERELPEVKPLQTRAIHEAKPSCDKYCNDQDDLHKETPHKGFVATMLGRRSRFRETDFKTYIALNRIIQGTAADYNKQKIVELHRHRKETGFLMRLTVHDEVQGDAQTPETAQRVSSILNVQSFPELKVPILWEVGTGKNWADAKD
jgi:DNA polymerase-1